MLRSKLLWLFTMGAICAAPYLRSSVSFENFEAKLPGAISHQPIPHSVVAAHGFRIDLAPTFLVYLGDDVGEVVYGYELLSAPAGLTLSREGILQWIPPQESQGISATLEFEITATFPQTGFSSSQTFLQPLHVLDRFPLIVTSASPKVGYDSNDTTQALVRLDAPAENFANLLSWSLIDPPPGVSINSEGRIHWILNPGYGSEAIHTVRVRVEHQTPMGLLSDEADMQFRILPSPLSHPIGLFRWVDADDITSGAGLGLSIAADGGWVGVSQPFIDSMQPTPASETGSVRLWQIKDGNYHRPVKSSTVVPPNSQAGQAFGASIALAGEGPGALLVVGAPEATSHGTLSFANSGAAHVYTAPASPDAEWTHVAFLQPDDTLPGLYFGGWVDTDGETIVASAEGYPVGGANSGALYTFYKGEGSTEWRFGQRINNPDVDETAGDYFGYPCAVDGQWIVAASNEDDDQGLNAGAVHVFRRVGGTWQHWQKLHAPIPHVGDLFGERLDLDGNWLFVASPRHDGNKGEVYVFECVGDTWTYRQALSIDGITGGFLGAALVARGEKLAVTAPGTFIASDQTEPTGGKQVHIYALKDGEWRWLNKGSSGLLFSQDTPYWGASVALIGPHNLLVGYPDRPKWTSDSSGLLWAGGFTYHEWSLERYNWAAEEARLAAIDPSRSSPSADMDDNGIPNLMEWVFDVHPERASDNLGFAMEVIKPFLLETNEDGSPRLSFLPVKNAGGIDILIEQSPDGTQWTRVEHAEWEQVESRRFKHPEGGNYQFPLQPVSLPAPVVPTFYRMRVIPLEG